jgi:hypothetical protein
MRLATLLAWTGLGLGLSLAGACGSVGLNGSELPDGGEGTGTCPCTVGNAGIGFTIDCGGSECVALNGTETGYRCDSAGTHVDPSVCNSPPADAGARDTGLIHDARADGGGGSDGAGHTPGDAACTSIEGGATCTGTGCYCSMNTDCTLACGSGSAEAGAVVNCEQASDCTTSCAGACQVNCEEAHDCTVDAGAGASVVCNEAKACNAAVGAGGSAQCNSATECNATGGADASLECDETPTCALTVGANGTVVCNESGACTATVGSGSTVECNESASCAIQCTGSCSVDCDTPDCRVSCAPDADCNVACGFSSVNTCPDGVTKVCGATACM